MSSLNPHMYLQIHGRLDNVSINVGFRSQFADYFGLQLILPHASLLPSIRLTPGLNS